jgi:hypothetical protein
MVAKQGSMRWQQGKATCDGNEAKQRTMATR